MAEFDNFEDQIGALEDLGAEAHTASSYMWKAIGKTGSQSLAWLCECMCYSPAANSQQCLVHALSASALLWNCCWGVAFALAATRKRMIGKLSPLGCTHAA